MNDLQKQILGCLRKYPGSKLPAICIEVTDYPIVEIGAGLDKLLENGEAVDLTPKYPSHLKEYGIAV